MKAIESRVHSENLCPATRDYAEKLIVNSCAFQVAFSDLHGGYMRRLLEKESSSSREKENASVKLIFADRRFYDSTRESNLVESFGRC